MPEITQNSFSDNRINVIEISNKNINGDPLHFNILSEFLCQKRSSCWFTWGQHPDGKLFTGSCLVAHHIGDALTLSGMGRGWNGASLSGFVQRPERWGTTPSAPAPLPLGWGNITEKSAWLRAKPPYQAFDIFHWHVFFWGQIKMSHTNTKFFPTKKQNTVPREDWTEKNTSFSDTTWYTYH